MRISALPALAALTALSTACVALALPASAAPGPSSELRCGSSTYLVDGFGRGQVLHVVGSRANFVVTYARLEPQGTEVVAVPGRDGRNDVVECTATNPQGQAYTFRGFFTPAA